MNVYAEVEISQREGGKTITVVPLKVGADNVEFKLNGKTYKVPRNSLTEESVEACKGYLSNDLSQGEISTLEKVNESAGHKLFSKSSLWDESGETVAERLAWRLESKKKSSSSYRLYPQDGYQFFGARPYCVTLYGGAADKPERLSLVYANKGDFGSTLGSGQNHFRQMHPNVDPPGDLDEAIELDERFISQALTKALGEAESQYYGEKEDKRKVLRWDAGDHAFLLSSKEGEYVHLLVVSTKDADAQGKIKFVRDEVLKKNHLENVTSNDFGDVWIDNIPMVNQGPKGYCAPATFERAMRYMNVPADMYLLATAATTQTGTNTSKLADDCKRIVRSKARRIKELELDQDLDIRHVKSFIDKGVPMLWQMCSLEQYNAIVNQRTEERGKVKDVEAWGEDLADEAERVESALSMRDNHHICMIIGYNESTGEIAVSDSWGPRYELRWVHVDIAKTVTTRGGFAIDF